MSHACTDKFFSIYAKNIYISCSLTQSDSYLYVNSCALTNLFNTKALCDSMRVKGGLVGFVSD